MKVANQSINQRKNKVNKGNYRQIKMLKLAFNQIRSKLKLLKIFKSRLEVIGIGLEQIGSRLDTLSKLGLDRIS